MKSHRLLTAGQVTGAASLEMILLCHGDLEKSQVPLPHSASSLSLQPTAASPFPSQHPSGGEGASPAPRLIWPWQLESRALYWPQPSPKGYIGIPSPKWTGSANRFGMSARLAELYEPLTHIRGCYMPSKTLQMNLELQLKEHLMSHKALS